MSSNALKIITWNSRGIRTKLNEFFDFLVRVNVDVALVSETWLKNDISMNHSDFNCYRSDRETGKGGGVAIVIRKNICHELLPIIPTHFIENIGIKITFDDNSVINVYSCYFPGGSAGPTDIKKINFKSDLKKFSRIQGRYILGGDFNSKHQVWGCIRSNCWGNILHDLTSCNAFGMVFPPEPTLIPHNNRTNPSVLDFFITNVPEKLSAALTLDNLCSDHLPVCISYNSCYSTTHNMRYDYRNTNWNLFKRYITDNISELNCMPINAIEDLDLLVIKLTTLIQDAGNASVPRKSVPHSYTKRLPRQILNLISLRNKSRRNWIRFRLNHLKALVSFLNKVISEKIFQFRNTSWNQMLKTLNKSSPRLWKISKILRKKTKCIPCLKENNITYTTNFQKAEVLAKKFHSNHTISSNLSDLNTKQMISESLLLLRNSDQSTVTISESAVKNILKNLKNKKSPGLDGVTNNILKKLPRAGISLLTRIFNACMKFGHFPTSWKTSKIIAIPKPGKKADSPDSYRPISLLSSVSKIFEKIIKDRILNFIEDNNILPRQQFGFRHEHNTIQPLVRIKRIVKNNFNEGKSTAMVLLDIKAAFDSVWHDALIHKLLRIGLDIPTVTIIRSYLTERSFKVHIGDKCSSEYSIPAGCPQGSCLSPVLYNIFIYDFPLLPSCESSIFADDTAILSSGTIADDILEKLQDSVNNVLNYFNKWNILVNPSKTNAIFFTRKRKPIYLPESKIKVANTDVNWETKVRYLGVILDKKLLFNEHVSYTINKINISTKMLYPFINRKSSLSIENKLLILKVIFHAIMYYAAPVWHDAAACHIKRLQIAQNKLLKMMYNLPYHFSTTSLHSLHDIPMIRDKINSITIKFFDKCVNSQFPHIRALSH